jgi:hypothetical protein
VAKGDEFLMRGGPTSKWKPIQWPWGEVGAWFKREVRTNKREGATCMRGKERGGYIK